MRGLVNFGVRKPVPINLLMIAIILGGLVAGWTLRREFFPQQDPEMASVTLIYPGASPEDIEETLARKVEDKLFELNDIVDELHTSIYEGGGAITVHFQEGTNIPKAIDDVERAIDQLRDLPADAEEITVQEIEPRLPVIRVAVYGDVEEALLKDAINAVEADLRSLPGMGEIVIDGVRDYEVRVDLDMAALVEHGLSLPAISAKIGDWLRDVPGGTVRTETGNVKVRTIGVPETAEEIRDIILKANPDGSSLRLSDIATVREGFVDEQIINRFNGDQAAVLTVYAVGDQDIVDIAEMVRAYIRGRSGEDAVHTSFESWRDTRRLQAWELGHSSTRSLAPGIQVAGLSDLARFVEGRLDLLTRNAIAGAVLVFITLLVFLNWRVAVWVGVGLITAMAGTILLMAWTDTTLNLLTMFGLIIVLGLLVDDAIVVSENIQTQHDEGKPALDAAVEGTTQVFWPVVATVLTTVVAFVPLTFIKGNIGDLLGALPIVVACALTMSLLEALLILPSHMGHSLAKRDRSRPGAAAGLVRRFEAKRDWLIHDVVIPGYGTFLRRSLRYRYISSAVAIAILVVSMGLVQSGRVMFVFLPSSDSETLVVNLQMPIGTPIGQTQRAVEKVEAAAAAQPEFHNIASVIGQSSNIDTGMATASSPHVAQMFIELLPVEQRDRESAQVIDAIRADLEGKIPDVERISFEEITGGPSGADITIRVAGASQDRVGAAVAAIKQRLSQFEGVFDIADDREDGQLELRITLKPAAQALGLDVTDVATQVRGFLYGIDAHVFADRGEDVDVRVRVDEAARRSLSTVEDAWIIAPSGKAVPLVEFADITEEQTYATIRRIDKQRAVTVTADVAQGYSPEEVVAAMTNPSNGGPGLLEDLRARFPGLDISFGGRQEQLADAFASLPLGIAAACVMIYVILAWLFSSYLQPLIVMMVIPFSLVGVIWGHLLLGYDMTFLSLIGCVALAGIVVNDSLILVEFYNEERARGLSVFESLVASGRARLRPIFLTTITTVLGLTPLILEQSFQAKFLIPMAIAIAGGLIATTVLILVVLPCAILIFSDIREAGYYLWHGRRRPKPQPLTSLGAHA